MGDNHHEGGNTKSQVDTANFGTRLKDLEMVTGIKTNKNIPLWVAAIMRKGSNLHWQNRKDVGTK